LVEIVGPERDPIVVEPEFLGPRRKFGLGDVGHAYVSTGVDVGAFETPSAGNAIAHVHPPSNQHGLVPLDSKFECDTPRVGHHCVGLRESGLDPRDRQVDVDHVRVEQPSVEIDS
jgi:hypothetical protein